ncbi:allantoate deiminase [Cerasibacillus quisquiliarum]|uniref:Zn-dependent hydrolase n=1 Tax=Cerasibacillus quisquiliarum TaxID=227865 RepID=A0A511UU06_9BACI|nr:Zn-dependent hydrolase [Cerasibacillus quisquiliarum]MBB5145044.1 allantoate deiminase [Cerasibacillus quisquiliarum]GEN30064.1 Zn-dependent hydrolase [Cerasibacillus quisquiliarum]
MTFNLQEKLLANYDSILDRAGVSGRRLAERLHAISEIGLTTDYGSNRPGYSKEEQTAKLLVLKWLREAGLHVYQDGAGNIIGRLEGTSQNERTIMSGSHVDSVPNGGHFDGVLGVVSALEVVEAWRKTGYQPRKSFEIIVFSDEEGARFDSGLNGSEAIVGNYDLQEKIKQKDKMGHSFRQVLENVGLSVDTFSKAKRDLSNVDLFVELHIEQGKRLEQVDLPCGIVTGIAGPCWLEVTFVGEAGHAGNTPMNHRKDALLAASEFILNVNQLPSQVSSSAVATVGRQMIKPNGVNVIPGKVTLFVDIRDIYQETRDQLVDDIIKAAYQIANKHQMTVNCHETSRVKPIAIEQETQSLLAEVVQEQGLKPFYLPSGAGHDAMVMGEKVPIAMLFVRSRSGISHNPKEWTDLNDAVQAVHILKRFIEMNQDK